MCRCYERYVPPSPTPGSQTLRHSCKHSHPTHIEHLVLVVRPEVAGGDGRLQVAVTLPRRLVKPAACRVRQQQQQQRQLHLRQQRNQKSRKACHKDKQTLWGNGGAAQQTAIQTSAQPPGNSTRPATNLANDSHIMGPCNTGCTSHRNRSHEGPCKPLVHHGPKEAGDALLPCVRVRVCEVRHHKPGKREEQQGGAVAHRAAAQNAAQQEPPANCGSSCWGDGRGDRVDRRAAVSIY